MILLRRSFALENDSHLNRSFSLKYFALSAISSVSYTPLHLIEEAIRQGKQVLYLLPEIALTTQITERLQPVSYTHLFQ